MNLNDFAKEVHENAVAHGWWDEERSDGTLRSLMHAELSEALEEYRANRPMVWHLCKHGGICEHQEVHCGEIGCETCKLEERKPEGIAVELIDFCIRALDTMAARETKFCEPLDSADVLIGDMRDVAMDAISMCFQPADLPDLVDDLHTQVALCCRDQSFDGLTIAVGVAMAWIREQGVDPVALMREKHDYNKTRSYKHGGKVC